MHWFTLDWWKYLMRDCSGWMNFWCRVRGHANWRGEDYGVVWYNPGGMGPDMHAGIARRI